MYRTIRYLGLGLGAVLSVAGCGRSSGGPATVPASGVVLFQGKPVEDANVTFAPQTQGTPAAFGRTDAEGRFKLMITSGQGAVPGSYGVTIAKETVEGGMNAEQAQAHFQKTGQAPPSGKVVDHLPVKYKMAKTSDLKATVQEKGENDFKFELKP